MNGMRFLASLALVSGVLLAASCVPPIEIGGEPTAAPVVSGAPQVANEKTWQSEWEKLKTGARKEGKVVISSGVSPGVRNGLNEAFAEKYGIELEFIAGQAAVLAPRILAERRAGIYSVDLVMGGVGAIDSALSPAGVLEPMDSALMLPEVLDKKAWWGDDLLWVDPNHLHIMFLAFPNYNIIVNTELVGNDEIRSYRDLLNPKWKGKIAYFDPRIPGGGRSLFMAMGEGVMDKEYLRELGKQDLVISRDRRLLTEWVARGRNPVGIGISPDEVTEFIRAGAPIRFIPVAEGTYITGSFGGLALMKNAPHPNARNLFVNWVLSREGQTVASRSFGLQSARNDVPTDFLSPIFLRQPAAKYVNAMTVEWEEKSPVYMKMIDDFWGHLIK
ncbi:MAG: extracellular solute-binding protein [Chloroflexi bacterium]|nr:extracellular solute-binding protein [Chloroflexota bacterium]